MKTALCITVTMLLVMLAARAGAEPLEFSITTTDGGTAISRKITGKNIIDLADDMSNHQGQFTPFVGRAYSANVQYLGVPNALRFNSNAAGTAVTLQIPSTGFSRTFTGATADDVQNQIEDFLKKEGAGEYAKFIQSINETSKAAPMDGNPQALTAWLTAGAFSRFAFDPLVNNNAPNLDGGGGFEVQFNAGAASTDDGDITTFDLALASHVNFSDTVALAWAVPIGWHSVDGADTYMVGAELGLPLTFVHPQPSNADRSVSWRLTPFVQFGAAGSEDLAAGGLIFGGGLASGVDLRFSRTILTIGNQAAYYGGTPLDSGDFRFDTDVSQFLIRNGVKVTQEIGDSGFVDAGVAYTNFINEAAIDGYVSPSVGVGLRFGRGDGSGVRIGYQGDFASGYTSNGGNLLLFFNW